jgi:hypothetical protein
MLSIILLSVVMLNVIMLSAIMLTVVMMRDIKLSFVIPNVVMVNVVAPKLLLRLDYLSLRLKPFLSSFGWNGAAPFDRSEKHRMPIHRLLIIR